MTSTKRLDLAMVASAFHPKQHVMGLSPRTNFYRGKKGQVGGGGVGGFKVPSPLPSPDLCAVGTTFLYWFNYC